jgi:lipopolysaccharide/colanic/teichoic acid biosynthesis glycosyltransferase
MNWGSPERGKTLLLAGDLLLAAATVVAAMLLHPGRMTGMAPRFGAGVIFALVFCACLYIFDLYDVPSLNGVRTLIRLGVAGLSGTLLCSFLFHLFQWFVVRRGSMAVAVPAFLGACYGWRRIYARHQELFLGRNPVLLIGARNDAVRLFDVLKEKNAPHEFLGYLQVGLSASPEPASGEAVGGALDQSVAVSVSSFSYSHAGAAAAATMARIPRTSFPERAPAHPGVTDFGVLTPELLEELVLNRQVSTLIVRPDSSNASLASALTRLRFLGVRVSSLPDFYNQVCEELPLDTLSDTWLSFAEGFRLFQVRFFRRLKRLVDILLAGTGLLVSLPISILAAAAIKLDSPGPILFSQSRVGWMERPFKLLKFRSMCQKAERDGQPQWASIKDPRVTRVGRILRRLHIDEIPQMINVLLGQMSFVGPRPERPAFVEQLRSAIPYYDLRHFVPPGITGWAQVNYPYGASVEDAKRKLQFDLFYIRNASPAMDFRILLRTMRVVLFRRGSR